MALLLFLLLFTPQSGGRRFILHALWASAVFSCFKVLRVSVLALMRPSGLSTRGPGCCLTRHPAVMAHYPTLNRYCAIAAACKRSSRRGEEYSADVWGPSITWRHNGQAFWYDPRKQVLWEDLHIGKAAAAWRGISRLTRLMACCI